MATTATSERKPSAHAEVPPGLDHEIAILGAGFSGLGAAIALDEAGFADFVILDRNAKVGGVWHVNTYPGIAVDIPSLSYSYSYAKNPRWSRVFAPGAELARYAEDVTDAYGLRARLRLNTEVRSARFDERRDRWLLELADGGVLRVRHVVSASGALTKPKEPEIPGLDSFRGHRMHTARWDHGHDLTGRKVAIIGTGASALQVIPEIAKTVEHLTVFQRTPIWVLPKTDFEVPESVKALLEASPAFHAAARLGSQSLVELSFVVAAHYHRYFPLASFYERMARRHLERQVKDPALRAKLTPNYGFGCKRPSISNTYLRAFNLANVSLVTESITEILPDGVRTADGRKHVVDTLISATGFKVFEKGNMPAVPIEGRSGMDLETFWDENRYQAYEGVSVPGFPNLFSILGPLGYNGSSFFQLIEFQSRHIVRCLDRARSEGATRVEVKAEANARYFRDMKARSKNQVFFLADCAESRSYYFDKHGDVPFRPSTSVEAQIRSRTFDLDDYAYGRAAEATLPHSGPPENALALGKKSVGWRDVRHALSVLPVFGSDPNRTDLVGEFIAALTGSSYLELRRRVYQDTVAYGILQERRDLKKTLEDRERLRSLPEGSFGRAYVEFTDRRALTPQGLADAIANQVGRSLEGPDATLAARVVDMHDLWHVLYGWDTDIMGELHLLGLSFAQLGSAGWIVLAMLSCQGLVLVGRPDGFRYVARSYAIGRKAPLLPAQDWEALLPLPLEEVRRRLGVPRTQAYQPFPVEEFVATSKKHPGFRLMDRLLNKAVPKEVTESWRVPKTPSAPVAVNA